MNMNFKHLGMYLLVGIISGVLCTGIFDWLSFPKIVNEHVPAVILAIAIVVAVRYISVIQFRNGWLSPVILTMACLIGWYLAIEFGSNYYRTDWYFVVSGAIGGISVAIGFALAWNLSRPGFAITVITMAGTLGGILLIFIFVVLTEMQTLILFVVWQSILLLGICISVQIDSSKSSGEQ
tara:strand:- start:204 stop:743 length:540 start_codon:yes stop_codon:yes gene_type:complete